MSNVYFPRIDTSRGTVLAVHRYPGEKVCARIHPGDARETIRALCQETSFTRTDRVTGESVKVQAEAVLAVLSLYCNDPATALRQLCATPGGEIRTARYSYRARRDN